MLTNATISITHRGVAYDQSTGRQTEETAVEVVSDVRCLISKGRAGRMTRRDGVREMVKPSYTVSFETYEDITITVGDQAEITVDRPDIFEEIESYTITDAVRSQGIRLSRWSCDIEKLTVPAENED